MVQPVLYRAGGIEQLQFDVVIVSPTLEECQHAQAATLDRIYVGELNNHDARTSLGENSVPQVVGSFTLDDPSFALHDSDVTHYLDVYVEHGVLRNTGR
jgi:hypothetical protein